MSIRSFRQHVTRQALFYVLTFGLASGIAPTCDPDVRSAIFGGFQSLATSFLNAFFIILEDTGTESTVTVQRPLEHSPAHVA